MSGPLSDQAWATIQASVPIVCVDVVPFRRRHDRLQVGLIRCRYADTGHPVWCHLGGRIRYGETVVEALQRHISTTVRATEGHLRVSDLTVGQRLNEAHTVDVQPHHVMQWFPPGLRTGDDDQNDGFGVDPRKHAVSLCFALDLGAELRVVPGGEGDRFEWFEAAELSSHDSLWPGTAQLVGLTLAAAGLD